MKQTLSQWFKCYKSYWCNLVLFVLSIMIATIFLYHSLLSYWESNIGLCVVNATTMAAILVIGFSQFKKFNDKNRYITFLQIKNMLEKQKYDQR